VCANTIEPKTIEPKCKSTRPQSALFHLLTVCTRLCAHGHLNKLASAHGLLCVAHALKQATATRAPSAPGSLRRYSGQLA